MAATPRDPGRELHHRHRAPVWRAGAQPDSETSDAVRLEELPPLLAAQRRQRHALRRPGELRSDDHRQGSRVALWRDDPDPPATDWRSIDHAWGGQVGFTVDRMPHIGRVKG